VTKRQYLPSTLARGGIANIEKQSGDAASQESAKRWNLRAAEIIAGSGYSQKGHYGTGSLVDGTKLFENLSVLPTRRGNAGYSGFDPNARILLPTLSSAYGNRVQLQQVMLNLIMNSIDAMKDVDGTRELTIKSQRAENEQLLMSVSDSGVGCRRNSGRNIQCLLYHETSGDGFGTVD